MRLAYQSIGDSLNAARGRPTGFDYMRIILALAVVISHAGTTSYGSAVQDAIYDSAARGSLRAILPMFFALSGFLVAGSMERCRTLIKFLGLRALRIYPALIVEVLLSAFLIGPFISTLSAREYFTDPLFLRYLVNVTGHISYYLPGVFETNPIPRVVNGQLWTVKFELYCYVVFALLTLVGALRHRVILPLAGLGLMAAAVVWEAKGQGWVVREYFRPLGGYFLVCAFLFGAAVYRYRDVLPASGLMCTVSAGLSLALLGYVPHGTYPAVILMAYVTACLGVMNPRKLGILKGADYSYGIFLYGFAVQQLVMYLLPGAREWYWNILICVPLTTLVAMASWHLVEKPALSLKWVLDQAERAYLSRRPAKQTEISGQRS